MINKGFTKFELALGLAVIAISVLVMLPPLQGGVQEDQATRAWSRAETIAWAVLDYRDDFGKWPEIRQDGVDLSSLTASNPTKIASIAMMGASGLDIGSNQAPNDDLIPDRPVLEEVPLDAWNRPFTVKILDLPPEAGAEPGTQSIVVLSAGPDGILETDPATWPLGSLVQVIPREATKATEAAGTVEEPVTLLVGDDMACILTRDAEGEER